MWHKHGESQQQATLFTERLVNDVRGNHPARVIDTYMDSPDTSELGFTYAQTKETGRKPYDPMDLLKLCNARFPILGQGKFRRIGLQPKPNNQ